MLPSAFDMKPWNVLLNSCSLSYQLRSSFISACHFWYLVIKRGERSCSFSFIHTVSPSSPSLLFLLHLSHSLPPSLPLSLSLSLSSLYILSAPRLIKPFSSRGQTFKPGLGNLHLKQQSPPHHTHTHTHTDAHTIHILSKHHIIYGLVLYLHLHYYRPLYSPLHCLPSSSRCGRIVSTWGDQTHSAFIFTHDFFIHSVLRRVCVCVCVESAVKPNVRQTTRFQEAFNGRASGWRRCDRKCVQFGCEGHSDTRPSCRLTNNRICLHRAKKKKKTAGRG